MTNSRNKILITQLAIFVDIDREESNKISPFLANYYNDETNSKVEIKTDTLYILATAIHKANARNASEFTLLTQFHDEKPKNLRASYVQTPRIVIGIGNQNKNLVSLEKTKRGH